MLFANTFDYFFVGQERLTCEPCNVEATIFTFTGDNNTYLWSTGATTPSESGLCDGQYSLIVTNTAANCVMRQSFDVVTAQDSFAYTIVAPFNVCEGANYKYYVDLPV
mgnify:CR=1 FL=1